MMPVDGSTFIEIKKIKLFFTDYQNKFKFLKDAFFP